MTLDERADLPALQNERKESSPLRTALPSRPMSSKANNSSLGARSPPPEDGRSQQGSSPSPLRLKYLERSPSVNEGPSSHPISPAPSASDPVPSEGQVDAPSLPAGSITTQSGQVCRSEKISFTSVDVY